MAGDPQDDFEHFFPADSLAVGVAECERDAGAGRGDGGEACFLEQAGAHHVLGVGQNENPRPLVELAEEVRFLALVHGRHTQGLACAVSVRTGLQRFSTGKIAMNPE